MSTKSKTSSFVSAMGALLEIVVTLVAMVKKMGGEVGECFYLLSRKENEGELEAIAARMVELFKRTKRMAENTFRLVVNYNQSLADMVSTGKYDWVNSDITEKHFPNTRRGKEEVSLHLVHFNRNIGSEDALRELDKMGFRPATIEELLAFGAQNPEEQRKYPIVALGSVWRHLRGGRCVPSLWLGGAGRRLGLGWWGVDWHSHCRFAAVSK